MKRDLLAWVAGVEVGVLGHIDRWNLVLKVDVLQLGYVLLEALDSLLLLSDCLHNLPALLLAVMFDRLLQSVYSGVVDLLQRLAFVLKTLDQV